MRLPIFILTALPYSLPAQSSGTCATPFSSGATIRGGSGNNLHFRVEIPRTMNLDVRCSAGDRDISGITEIKDVELNARNPTIAVGDAAAYRRAEGSVLAGNIVASPFGEIRDGLFRSFSKDNPSGRYRLRAELLAGNLTLR
jgi:hypothetical protein